MTQTLIFGFPVPVVLAFGLLVLVLLALGRVLAAMRKAPPVRVPPRQVRERADSFGPDEETLFRLGRLEISPLGEHPRHHR
jgi:hypothetical protein